MNYLGIRAIPLGIYFAVFDSEKKQVVTCEKILVPPALHVPDRLKYIRNSILDVLREYSVDYAGIRLSEPSAKSISMERVQMEGVIQESFASSDLIDYFYGPISTIESRLDCDRGDFKKFVQGDKDYGVEGWDKMRKHEREAVLCSIGAVIDA